MEQLPKDWWMKITEDVIPDLLEYSNKRWGKGAWEDVIGMTHPIIYTYGDSLVLGLESLVLGLESFKKNYIEISVDDFRRLFLKQTLIYEIY